LRCRQKKVKKGLVEKNRKSARRKGSTGIKIKFKIGYKGGYRGQGEKRRTLLKEMAGPEPVTKKKDRTAAPPKKSPKIQKTVGKRSTKDSGEKSRPGASKLGSAESCREKPEKTLTQKTWVEMVVG